MRLCRPILVAFLLACAAAPAHACATVSFAPAVLTVPAWDPITPAAQQVNVTMTVTRASPSTGSVRLIFLDGNDSAQPVRLGARAGSSGPFYQLLTAGGANIVYPQGTVVGATSAPLLDFPAKGAANSIQVVLRLVVPANVPGTDFSNGVYTETLSYAVQCLGAAGKPNGSVGPLSGPAASLSIPNLVSLTTASAATLDFQNFTSLSQQLNVGVRSTGPVTVDIRSANNLRLVRQGASAPFPENSQIAYALSLRGVDIARTPALLSNQPRAGVAGTSWPLILSLPAQPAGKVAGSYSDTLTLTLTPGL